MTEAIIANNTELVNEQRAVMNKIVLDQIDTIKTELSALLDLLNKQKSEDGRYIAVISELNYASDSLDEAYMAAEYGDYTEKAYGLNLADYAKKLAYGLTQKEAK
ncbi:hypothetical protein IJJ27_04390 [bacterium]|nr:hypothetical protein [bacterium]